MLSSARGRAYAFFALCSLSLLLIAAGCTRNAPPDSPPTSSAPAAAWPARPASSGAETRTYVGDAACAGCHHALSSEHEKSNHALTLHTMEPAGLGKVAPPVGRLPGLPFVLKTVKEGYCLDTYPPSGALQPLDYAFGAGKHGVTYASLMPDNQMLEMRESYFPRQRQWRATPGQEKIPHDYAGRVYEPVFSRKCFGCHVVTLPSDTLKPERRFLGVGCEACHGPASAHVTAMEAKPNGATLADVHIERIRTWGAQRINEMCGNCHGTAASLNASKPDLLLTPRFQPYALMLSRCFRESKDTLSCATCHNAHQNTSHDLKAYESACLACHAAGTGGTARPRDTRGVGSEKETERNREAQQSEGGARQAQEADTSATAFARKSCPVNPRAGCIGCHMPMGRVMPGSMVGSVAPDHYIRVYRPEQEAAQTRQSSLQTAPAVTNIPGLNSAP